MISRAYFPNSLLPACLKTKLKKRPPPAAFWVVDVGVLDVGEDRIWFRPVVIADVLAAARDFSERRSKIFSAVQPKYFEVHSTGDHSADITEGTKSATRTPRQSLPSARANATSWPDPTRPMASNLTPPLATRPRSRSRSERMRRAWAREDDRHRPRRSGRKTDGWLSARIGAAVTRSPIALRRYA